MGTESSKKPSVRQNHLIASYDLLIPRQQPCVTSVLPALDTQWKDNLRSLGYIE